MNDDKIKEVREASNIVDVISSYLPLVKKGKNFFGVCPFHDDNNPSMSVSYDKQIYKCFSCGASGNVFNFIMDYEHVDFKEALNILAKRAGISIGNININSQNKYEKYYKMYDLSLKFYQNNINSLYGKDAKEYLYKRGINDELIKHFKIGLSLLEKDKLTKILIEKNYTKKEMEIYGLGNGFNDLYINRIMFPLFDVSSRVVGFSGRIYNSSSDSKYINTKETPIFKKGEMLYNFYDAKDFVRLEKKIIIVEGFMDVIRLYSVGIKNVVALMGTSLTKEQISLLKRLSNNVYLSLDGDEAGLKAMANIGGVLEENGFNVRIIKLSSGLDPDEFVLKYKKEGYMALYENPMSYSEFKIDYMKEKSNLASIDDKAKYINDVLNELKQEKDEIKQELILKKISIEFNIDIEILKNKLQKIEKCSKIETLKKEPVKIKKLDKYQKATYEIINFMLNSYEAVKLYEIKLNYLPYLNARYLANEIIYWYKKNGSLILADFITSLSTKQELFDLLKEVMEFESEEFDLDVMKEYINVILGYSSNQEIKRLKEIMREEPDQIKKAQLAEKIRLVKIGELNLND